MKSQKEEVVDQVIAHLPTFNKYKDNAILLLTNQQLESIKSAVQLAIVSGLVDYSKDKTNLAEVRSYARSMVMNHLKKAKELNGGHSYVSNSAGTSSSSPKTVRVKEKIAPKGVNPDLLTDELKEYVKTLV